MDTLYDDIPVPTSDPPKSGSNIGSNVLDFGLGAASNFVSTLINQAFARRNAEMNYEYGQKAADADFQRKLTFWDIENRYNSPARQVQRRLQAGLSPFESVDSGNSQGLDTAVTPNQAGLRGPIDFDASIDLLDSMRTFSEINMMAKNGDKIDQEISNMLKQEYLLGLEAELKKLGKDELAERIKGIIQDNENKKKEGVILGLQPGILTANLNNLNEDWKTKQLFRNRYNKENIYFYDDNYYLKKSQTIKSLLNTDLFNATLNDNPVGEYLTVLDRLLNLIIPLRGILK